MDSEPGLDPTPREIKAWAEPGVGHPTDGAPRHPTAAVDLNPDVVSVFMGVSPFPIIFFKAFLGILVLFSDSGSLLCGTTFE